MYKVGDYIVAKKTHTVDGLKKFSVIKNQSYKIVKIGYHIYDIMTDDGYVIRLHKDYFYTKQEIREIKLNKLLCLR